MKKFSSILLVVLLTFSLSACKKKTISNEDPQTVVNKAWEKQIDESQSADKGTYTFEGKGTLKAEKSETSLEGSGEVKFDKSNTTDPKVGLTVKLKGNGNLEGKKGSFDLGAETRFMSKKLYALIQNVDVKTEDEQVNMMANLFGNFYKSQWVEIPFDGLDTSVLAKAEGDAEQAEKIREIAKKNPILDVKKDLGDRTYDIAVNMEKLATYIKEVSAVEKTNVDDSQMEMIRKFLSDLTYTMQVKINEDYDLTWIKLGGSAADKESDQNVEVSFEATMDSDTTDTKGKLVYSGKQSGSLEGSLKTKKTSGKATIDVPKGSKPFDLGALMGGGFGQ